MMDVVVVLVKFSDEFLGDVLVNLKPSRLTHLLLRQLAGKFMSGGCHICNRKNLFYAFSKFSLSFFQGAKTYFVGYMGGGIVKNWGVYNAKKIGFSSTQNYSSSG